MQPAWAALDPALFQFRPRSRAMRPSTAPPDQVRGRAQDDAGFLMPSRKSLILRSRAQHGVSKDAGNRCGFKTKDHQESVRFWLCGRIARCTLASGDRISTLTWGKADRATRDRNGGSRMSETAPSFPVIREAVASFPDREYFRGAVSSLLAAGFEPSDL